METKKSLPAIYQQWQKHVRSIRERFFTKVSVIQKKEDEKKMDEVRKKIDDLTV